MRICVLALLLCSSAWAVEKAAYDSNGRIIALTSEGEDLDVTSSVVAVYPNAKRVPLLGRGSRAPMRRDGGQLSWSGPFELPDGGRGRLQLKAEEDASSVHYTATVTADFPLDLEALEFVLDLPRPVFLGGQVTPQGGSPIAVGALKPADNNFFRGETAALRLDAASARRTLDVSFDAPRQAALFDRWDARGRSFQLRAAIRRGGLARGESASLAATLRLTDKPGAEAPARLSVESAKTRFRFDGFGADYCWNNASPIAAYTLDNLKIAWGRSEMKVMDWDRERDNPGPAIRADMETMRRFQQMGVPYVISIWWLPERFYTDPYEKPRSAHFRKIDPAKWDELLDLIGSYLVFAKREYSVEPDLFSFNESNIGVYVGLTAEDHIEQIKRFGAYFRKLGLKTRMLLGDATGPRDTHKFVLAAAADPEAMQFVAAIGFHSWGGGTPEQYEAWGDVAEWLHLPLLVTELGVDAAAYHGRSWDSYHYGLREARMIQELVTYARPQGTQFWQFTNDYALARVGAGGKVEPTPRFWIMKHFTNLTPQKSEVVASASDQPSVLITAFRSGTGYAIHILNLGASREATVEGLPDADWQAVETTEAVQFQEKPAGKPTAGALHLTLPGRSVVTLTSSSAVTAALR